MNEDLLDAAARVLSRHGAAGFTTNRVAEVAGVSIGSLYQYYPNKAALLLRLHERDAERAWAELQAILDDERRPARRRLEDLVRRFFEIENDAPEQHGALHEAQALITGTPEFRAFEARVVARFRSFLEAAIPARRAEHEFLARLCFTVVTATGERISTRGLPPGELRQLGKAISQMICDFLGL